MTETCPFNVYETSPVLRSIFQMRVAGDLVGQGPVALLGRKALLRQGRPSLCCRQDRAVTNVQRI